MTNEDIDRAKLRVDEERLAHEKARDNARLQLESSFSKKYGTPLLVAIVVGVFSLGQVWIASIQKDREIDLAASEQERRWKLTMAEFIFQNREVIFSTGKDAEQKLIIKVIAVTFPSDVADILLESLVVAVPDEQKQLWKDGRQLVKTIRDQKFAPN